MQSEYDFSKGKRGKFYRKNISLKLPVYLNADNLVFIQNVAEKNKSDISVVVNDLIRKILNQEVS